MRTIATLNTIAARLFILAAFILGVTGTVKAQGKIEIVIVASSHDNPKPAEEYRYVVDKLKNYKPDMVFGEYLSPTDQKAAMEAKYWGTKRLEQKYNYLLVHNPKAVMRTAQTDKAYQALDKFAYYHKTRMNLARDLVLNRDMANAEYQLYVLTQHMQKRFGRREQKYFEKVFGSIDSLQKAGFLRGTSEYHKIYFPLAYELGHPKIYPADCQQYDADWNKAWQNAVMKRDAMNATAKADSTSKEADAVKALAMYSAAANERMKGIDYTSYEFLNSALYAELDEFVNFLGGPEFFNEPGYITEEVKQMLHWWEKRNKGICANIIRQARKQGARRVVVAVGSSHRKGMEEIFTRMPEVKLVNYNDLP